MHSGRYCADFDIDGTGALHGRLRKQLQSMVAHRRGHRPSRGRVDADGFDAGAASVPPERSRRHAGRR